MKLLLPDVISLGKQTGGEMAGLKITETQIYFFINFFFYQPLYF